MTQRTRTIAGWVLSVLASMVFLFAAFPKLTGNPMAIEGFARFGLPVWFMYGVGVAEVAGVALLLFTKRRLAGAGLLGVVGIGACFEHATHAQLGMAPIPLVVAAFAVAGAFLRGAPAKVDS
jgi:hypothetical protein